ncbi:hypothetical protein Mal4_19620 [Maioricimonas rarisocia]|uniref:Uncharacterized protein n=1 Tax=Maioricimonas rarisocia TaxID=2528026 RepID=A0A517Z5B5_9PLAN|nr:hypothetical protein [Maioricimonas rarisocia]QDU37647.1 hypothetical protein Mal4_19620 [Maioricimonas rarisocia]
MTEPRNRVVVVEDTKQDRRTLLNQLTRYHVCEPEDILGAPETYDAALAMLDAHATAIRLVFLDLNIPRNEQEASSEDFGGRLLDHIHALNARSDVRIRVIVVSGQDTAIGWSAERMLKSFPDTLVGIAEKRSIDRSLVEQLQKLDRDPLRDALCELQSDIVGFYDTVFDPTARIRERLADACSIAIRLLRNEMDHFLDKLGASEPLADDLPSLIKQVRNRFAKQTIKRRDGREFEDRFVSAAAIEHGTWEAFLWRGTMVEHLYTLNAYRNDYVHVKAKPFESNRDKADTWEIPTATLQSVKNGERLGQVIELIVGELLEWYLPWHEQVYLPWTENQRGGAS